MLHGVDGSGSVVSISADDLSRLIDAIRNSGHEIVPLTRWLSESGDRQIALTFDDGFESLRNAAAPLLAEAGAPATLFLTTGSLGGESRWPSLPEGAAVFPMLGWDDVRHLHESGWEIEAHTVTHPDLRACSDSEIAEEMEGSAAAIERELGRRPRVFAYPYGFCDDRVVAAARQSFEWAVTARMTGALQPAGDPHRVPRLDAYYFRSPVLSRAFGSKRFSQYLSARAWLRRMRGHPAES
jgi:peptidoglycan/xylan/chitin deacetylase (PgdA/CDA1 family)